MFLYMLLKELAKLVTAIVMSQYKQTPSVEAMEKRKQPKAATKIVIC